MGIRSLRSSQLQHLPVKSPVLSIVPSLAEFSMGAQPKPRRSRLLSLTTELLLLILDNSHTSTLLALSRTSRRLHYLALPVYLSRHGIQDPASRKLVLENHAVQALPGLHTSLFFTSLDHLSYKFRGIHPQFTREVNQLLRFVTRLTQVDKVILDLGNIDSRSVDGLAIASSNLWKQDFIQLLTVILRRRCTSLTVTHGRFLNPRLPSLSSSRSPSTLIDDSISVIRKLLLGPSPHGSPASHEKVLQPISNADVLRELCVDADILLSYPFYDWTMMTINANPVTSLSLRIHGLHPAAWTTILTCISIPTLTHFSPETTDITFANLLKFFSRHPSIVDIGLHPYINHSDSGRRPKPRNPKERLLPNLASLSGNSGNIMTLLNHLRPAPQLRSISLSLSVRQRVFQTSDFENLNREIGMVIQDTRPVTLSLRFLVRFISDEHFGNTSKQEHHLHSFDSVQILNLSTDGHFDFTRWITPVLLHWLSSAFPALHRISFAGDCVPVEPECCTAFIHTIQQVYQGVEVVIVAEEDGEFQRLI